MNIQRVFAFPSIIGLILIFYLVPVLASSGRVASGEPVSSSSRPALELREFATGKAAPISPNLDTPVLSNIVAFEWSEVYGATRYRLWVGANPYIATIDEEFTDRQYACKDGRCAVDASTPLIKGSYQWWILAYSDTGGWGDWSDGLSFYVTPPPDKPMLISPSGKTASSTVTFTWNAVKDAPWIQLDAVSTSNAEKHYNSGWFDPQTSGYCSSAGTCSYTPLFVFTTGVYQWKMQAKYQVNNRDVIGPWSDTWAFDTAGYAAQVTSLWPVDKAKTGGIADLWAEVKNTQNYYSLDPNAAVWFWVSGPNWTDHWIGSANVGNLEAGGRGWYRLQWGIPSTATAGNYSYWAQVWQGSNVLSAWSERQDFIVEKGQTTLPGKAILISPSPNDTITTTTPTYKWNAVAGSTSYQLWVSDSVVDGRIGKPVPRWYEADTVGCPSGAGTCSITPADALARGSAMWWIQTRNAAGEGPWSDGMGFTVGSKTSGPYGIEFVDVPAGTFRMGGDPGFFDTKPLHQVVISKAFQLGKYEITQGQWIAAMGNNPSQFKGSTDLPVDSISWNDVQPFLTKLNALNDGYVYRMPTEAEWEYACRAGTTADRAGNLDEMAWYSQTSGNKTHPVGTKKANAWGLYDMYGNVAEWVQDWYDKSYYASSPLTDPQGPAQGTSRVWRGGSWVMIPESLFSYTRGNNGPLAISNTMGFRLLRVPITK